MLGGLGQCGDRIPGVQGGSLHDLSEPVLAAADMWSVVCWACV
jgi:hypothetical protein